MLRRLRPWEITPLVTALPVMTLLALSLPSAPTSAAPADPRLAVTGYVEAGDAPDLIAHDAAALATVGVDGVTLRPDGASVTSPDDDTLRLLAAAHQHGLTGELLLSNYSARLDDFDPHLGSRLLRHAAHRDAVASQLAGLVADQGWDGVQVDLESLRAGDADGLAAFVSALRAELPAGRTVSIAVMASSRAQGYLARGYRLAALAATVDTIALMTYDQHGPGWSGPGPIGALGWQRRGLQAALEQVPPAQLDLGVAGYGYLWRRNGSGRTVSDAAARSVVARDGAQPRWHRAIGEWSAGLADGTTLWWSDARSYALRATLARQAGLHGLALWQLASSDPLT